MPDKKHVSLIDHFSVIEDPRIERRREHKLIDILTIAICAVLCGADDFTAMEAFGEAKEEWFRTFLQLPNGIPSHDTFGRVFSLIDNQKFCECFTSWVSAVTAELGVKLIAIDGKTSRRSYDKSRNKPAIHMVSAFATEFGLTLGQVKTDEKSNEITAIPALLSRLTLSGCVVTIDAMGCQREIAAKIVDKGGDYVLAVKGNQKELHEDVKLFFDDAADAGFKDTPHDYYETVEKGHGRIETRRYFTTYDTGWLAAGKKWRGLKMIGMVESEREIGDSKSVERRYYIGSLENNAKVFGVAVRNHWAIENKLHWSLDVMFREDDSRIRIGNAAENMAILRHMALNILRQEKTSKRGVKTKRLNAGWDEAYLVKLLGLLKI
jgi:predicted transposase YbfD/YdcC